MRWAVAIAAILIEDRHETTILNVAIVTARSNAEARGIGLNLAEERWPRDKGYFNHMAVAGEIEEAIDWRIHDE